MRDSMGATWVFSICLTFIVLFTAYLTISLNYSRAFKIKNYVVSYIEENEGYNSDYEEDITNYLNSEGYTAFGDCENRIEADGYEDEYELQACLNQTTTGQCGICIYRSVNDNDDGVRCSERSTYRVIAFFKFDIPIVKYFSSFQVGGESRYIYDFAGTLGCQTR